MTSSRIWLWPDGAVRQAQSNQIFKPAWRFADERDVVRLGVPGVIGAGDRHGLGGANVARHGAGAVMTAVAWPQVSVSVVV